MRRSERAGGAAIEFALVGSLLIFLILATIEIGWQMATGIALEHGAHDAVRFALTGQSTLAGAPASPATRPATIVWIVTRSAPGLLQPGLLSVQTQINNHGSFVGPASASFAGGTSDLVNYVFDYRQPYVTPLGSILHGGSFYDHQIGIVAKNEPFPAP